MEIGRHAEDVGDDPSISMLKMPSRQSSRQASQDPQRPSSRDSMHSGARGFRSSVSREFQDDMDYGFSTPVRPHDSHGGISTWDMLTIVFDSQRELLEKESREFCEYYPRVLRVTVGSCNSRLTTITSSALLFKNSFLLRKQVDLSSQMLFIILAVLACNKCSLTQVLATRGVIVVAQTEPYGEISLQMVI